MTFNGLTDNQAESHRKQFGSNRAAEEPSKTAGKRFAERFGRVPVKVYIIILLLCLCFGIIFSLGGGLHGIIPCIISVAVNALSLFIVCVWESTLYSRKEKARSLHSGNKCRVYRCGNSVAEVNSGDIVKGDYVLLTAGDIVPAEGIVQTGDITVGKDGRTDLVRRDMKDELEEDISGEYTLEKGTLVTSGHAVMKVTHVEESFVKPFAVSSKKYTFCIFMSAVLTALLVIFAAYQAEKSGSGMISLPMKTALFASLILMSGAGLKDPLGEYLSAGRAEIRRNGADMRTLTPKCDLLFIDRSGFVTDGTPTAVGFTDGSGSTMTKFYEVPYPLGTIAANAAAENTSALVNKGRIISADPYEAAEMTFMAERLKSTVELEINAELVKGDLPVNGYKRFLRGDPSEIISGCESCFDGTGKEKAFSSAAAVKALAEELIFQGNSVIAYAAELWDGRKVFIGMMTIREKYRSDAENVFKKLAENGCKPILLVPYQDASLRDKAVAGAGADDVISYKKLIGMIPGEAAKALKKVKMITGRCDKSKLIELAKTSGKTVGTTAVDVHDALECENADAVYASAESCTAAKEIADCTALDGIDSIAVGMDCADEIRKSASAYEALRAVIIVLMAAAMYFGAKISIPALGIAVIIGATAVGTLLTGVSALRFGRICKRYCAESGSKEVRS